MIDEEENERILRGKLTSIGFNFRVEAEELRDPEGRAMTTSTAPDQVSDAVAKTLRAAMERLLTGRPTCTDGRLIKENLYREAGVSRATMNRAHGILAEWDRRTAASEPEPRARPAATTNSPNSEQS
ncbi:MAG: hypothetical protein LBV60_22910 [Streptomyces sp.]|nr:hypothetical protein [Streptomyces sp.]